MVFGASLASRIGELLTPTPAQASEFPMLIEREREIVDLIAAGKNNSQIAAERYLAPRTVRNNVSAGGPAPGRAAYDAGPRRVVHWRRSIT